ncbi:MAG: hypothetical protein RSC43_00240 [Clostridia bacterium]
MSGEKRIGIGVILTSVCDERWLFTWILQLCQALKEIGTLKNVDFYISSMSKMKDPLLRLFAQLGVSYNLVTLENDDFKNYKLHQLELLLPCTFVIVLEHSQLNEHLDSLIKSYRTKLLIMPQAGASFNNSQIVSITKEIKT